MPRSSDQGVVKEAPTFFDNDANHYRRPPKPNQRTTRPHADTEEPDDLEPILHATVLRFPRTDITHYRK